jgi:hypothetical protein
MQSLRDNTTGSNNTAVGLNALRLNTTASNNVAIGHTALDANTTGAENTAVGALALDALTTANHNSCLGDSSLTEVTTGTQNTAIGRAAGSSISTGSNNTCLGYNSGTSGSPGGILGSASNLVVIGDNNVTNIYAKVSVTATSDERDKTDIADFTKGLDIINSLRPVTYKWDMRSDYDDNTPNGSKKGTSTELGLIAQEVLTVEKANGFASSNDDSLIVNLSPDGEHYGLKYERVVPILVNAIKELSAKVTALEAG